MINARAFRKFFIGDADMVKTITGNNVLVFVVDISKISILLSNAATISPWGVDFLSNLYTRIFCSPLLKINQEEVIKGL